MYRICLDSKEDCYLIYNTCKSIWRSDGTSGGNIQFLINYYLIAEDFPVMLKYNSKLNALSFEESWESNTIEYVFELSVTKFIEYINKKI